MIWLRRQIGRGRRHPLLAILVVFLLVFAAAHGTADQAAGGEYVCVILGFLVFLSLLVPRPRVFVARIVESGRAPPNLVRSLQVTIHQVAVRTPLRL